MKTPVLTICVLTKDRPHYLRETIQSCVAQDGLAEFAVEICVADNSTTDSAREVLAEFQNRAVTIKYHKHPKDIGFDANVLYALGMASADYAMWLGDDDVLMPGAIREIARALARKPDFILLNGYYTTAELSQTVGQIVTLSADATYNNPAELYAAHWLPMPTGQIALGAFVVRTRQLPDGRMDEFIGAGGHSFSGYVFVYLNEIFQRQGKIDALVLSKLLVKLRGGIETKVWKDKTIIVWFHFVPDWLALLAKIPLYRQMALAKRDRYLRVVYGLSYLMKVRRNNAAHWHLIPKPESLRLRLNYWVASVVPVKLQQWIRNLRPARRSSAAPGKG